MDNPDKRRFDRSQLVYYLRVFHGDADKLAGYLGDISSQGLMLFSKNRMPLKKVFRFSIDLDTEFEMSEKLVFEARSLWEEKDANPEYYLIGFEFTGLDQKAVDTVAYLTQKYGFVR